MEIKKRTALLCPAPESAKTRAKAWPPPGTPPNCHQDHLTQQGLLPTGAGEELSSPSDTHSSKLSQQLFPGPAPAAQCEGK